jgi:hypothetical protein
VGSGGHSQCGDHLHRHNFLSRLLVGKVNKDRKFKYLETVLTNQNYIHEEIKNRLKSGNACYHSVQNLLSSSLLSKNVKIKVQRTIILPAVLYGCETWSLTLKEKRRNVRRENRGVKKTT